MVYQYLQSIGCFFFISSILTVVGWWEVLIVYVFISFLLHHHRHHSRLLNASIKQVNCVGAVTPWASSAESCRGSGWCRGWILDGGTSPPRKCIGAGSLSAMGMPALLRSPQANPQHPPPDQPSWVETLPVPALLEAAVPPRSPPRSNITSYNSSTWYIKWR